jgi:type II secretory pathway pseudopilin PulG
MTPRSIHRRGLTLLEALMAAVLLALVAGAVIAPFTAAAQNNAQEARQTLAVSCAQELMEEILSKRVNDPDGSEAGESGRGNWDDMVDYDGYTEAEGGIVGADGSALAGPGSAGLSRTVTVRKTFSAGPLPGQTGTFAEIVVEVRHRGSPLAKLIRLAYDNGG